MQHSDLDDVRKQLRELDVRTRRMEATCNQVLWLLWVLGGGGLCLLLWGMGWRLVCLGVACVFVTVPLVCAASARLAAGLPSERMLTATDSSGAARRDAD